MNLTTWLDSFQAWYSSLSTTQSSSLHLVVAAAGVWLLLKGLGYCVTVVRLATLRLPAPGLRVVDAGEIPAEERALLDAYGAILNALGFRPAFSAVFDALQRYSDYWLHIDSLSTASVQRASNPQDGPLAQVVFVSLTSDGVSHITTNRLSYASISTPDRFIVHDAMASSLAAHWRAHAARLTARADWKILDREKIEIETRRIGCFVFKHRHN